MNNKNFDIENLLNKSNINSFCESDSEKWDLISHMRKDLKNYLANDILYNSTKIPDKYYTYACFVCERHSPELSNDFPFIANAFLAEEFSKLPTYKITNYQFNFVGNHSPLVRVHGTILNLMLNAAQNGSSFSKTFLINIYKTYFKAEYKQLKRFSKISTTEILSLVDEYPDWDDCMKLSLISTFLTMSELMGITIDDDCCYLYHYIKRALSDDIKNNEHIIEMLEISDELISEAIDWCDNNINFDEYNGFPYVLKRSSHKILSKNEHFLGSTNKYYGFGYDYPYAIFPFSTKNFYDTAQILKSLYPNKELSIEEIESNMTLLHSSKATLYLSENLSILIDGMLGLNNELSNSPMLYNDSIVPKPIANNKPEQKSTINHIDKFEVTDESSIIDELEKTRSEMHNLEVKYNNLQFMYKHKLNQEKQNEILTEKINDINSELVHLRNHLYEITETDIQNTDSIDIDFYKKQLSTKRITIIGGHTNWTNKLKHIFPAWNYIYLKAADNIDFSIINNSDFVYFFTDCLKHSTYYKAIGILRNNQTPYNYIHSVNINSNILQIYNDLFN